MAKQTRTAAKAPQRRAGGSGIGKLLLGVVIGAVTLAAGAAAYLRFANPPVAVSDKAALWEPMVLSVPLNARAKSEAKTAPFPESEDGFEAGARLYRAHCASCHGAPGRDSALGRAMAPHAQQFFSVRERKALAAQTPGELYWKTAYGIRRSGMPAYGRTLTDTQIWQTSLLLHSAGDDLPDPVKALLTEGLPPAQPSVVKP